MIHLLTMYFATLAKRQALMDKKNNILFCEIAYCLYVKDLQLLCFYLVYPLLKASLQSTRNFSITRIVCGFVKSVSSPRACKKFLLCCIKSQKLQH